MAVAPKASLPASQRPGQYCASYSLHHLQQLGDRVDMGCEARKCAAQSRRVRGRRRLLRQWGPRTGRGPRTITANIRLPPHCIATPEVYVTASVLRLPWRRLSASRPEGRGGRTERAGSAPPPTPARAARASPPPPPPPPRCGRAPGRPAARRRYERGSGCREGGPGPAAAGAGALPPAGPRMCVRRRRDGMEGRGGGGGEKSGEVLGEAAPRRKQ
jgi:hypothetical protein